MSGEIWVALTFNEKDDIQDCGKYSGIRLVSHTIKTWERVVDHRTWEVTTIMANQFGFRLRYSTKEPIFILRHGIDA